MKRVFKFALMFFAAATIASCGNDGPTVVGGEGDGDGDTPGPGPSTENIKINLTAPFGAIATRSQINSNMAIWSAGDVIAVAEVKNNSSASVAKGNAIQSPAASLSQDLKTAFFTISVPEDEKAKSFRYLAAYPYTALNSFEPGSSSVSMTMPANQTASVNSVDPNAMLMVATTNSYEAQPTGTGLSFKQVGAYGALLIQNLNQAANAHVTSVTIQAKNGQTLAGTYLYNYDDSSKSSGSGSDNLTINVNALNYKNDSSSPYLTVLFASLPAVIDGYTVTVNSSSGKSYTKEVTETLTLEPGTFTTATIDFKGVGDDQTNLPTSFRKLTSMTQFAEAVGKRLVIAATATNGKTYVIGNTLYLGMTKGEVGGNSYPAPCLEIGELGITIEGDVMTGTHMTEYSWIVSQHNGYGSPHYDFRDDESLYLYSDGSQAVKIYNSLPHFKVDMADGAFRIEYPSNMMYLCIGQDGGWAMLRPTTGWSYNILFYQLIE